MSWRDYMKPDEALCMATCDAEIARHLEIRRRVMMRCANRQFRDRNRPPDGKGWQGKRREEARA